MFGYIAINKAEMKFKDYDMYQAYFKDFSSVKSSFLLFALLFLPKSLTKLHKSVAKPFEYILF